MKQILKRFWVVICLAVLINVPLLVVGTVRTNQSVLLKGDTTNINSIVSVDTAYGEKGSFSSVYVISFDRSTVLQNFFVKLSSTSVLEPVSENYTHFTDAENYQMGQIQKNSSIMTSLITAYTYAQKRDSSIYIDYALESLCVSFYFKGSVFRIGDKLLEINGSTPQEGLEAFQTAALSAKEGDTVKISRNGTEMDIVLSEGLYDTCRWYPYYSIDYDTISPQVRVNRTSVGGPSGGLLQTLSIFNRLVEEDYTKGLKIAGTGTMSVSGKVGAIGGIQQKIYTAFDDGIDVFFCPSVHYEEALEAYNKLKNKEKMALVAVSTLEDAIGYLENV